MTVSKFPDLTKKFELQTYSDPKSVEELRLNHVPFSGSPQKHPFELDRIVLVVDPYSSNTVYYDFHSDDIAYVEELPHIVNLDGKIINMVRIWVKKMSMAIRCSPFMVMEIV